MFYWPFQGGTSFVDLLFFCSVLCLLCFVRVCLYVLSGHLLGKGWPLGSRLWCLLWVCHFPIGILGQVWYLIVSIPDLCNLTYFYLYRYHKIRKAFSKFYYRHSELIVKYNIGLKTLLQQGISEPIFYGDLVYKFKRIVGKPNFSDQFKKIVKRYIRVGYNLDIMRQSACLVLIPITIYSYGFLFNCTSVGQASESMTALT